MSEHGCLGEPMQKGNLWLLTSSAGKRHAILLLALVLIACSCLNPSSVYAVGSQPPLPKDSLSKSVQLLLANDSLRVVVVPSTGGSGLVGYLGIIKDVLVILGIIFGSFLGYEALFRGLKSEQIQKILDNDMADQRALQEKCHSLVDELFSPSRELDRLTRDQLQALFIKIKELDIIANKNRTVIANTSFMLKHVIQNILRYCDQEQENLLTNLLNPIADILQSIEYQSQRFISFPSFWQFVKFSKKSITRKSSLSKFVLDHSFRYYAFYDKGLRLFSISTEYLEVLDAFCHIYSNLISRSVFRLFDDPHSMLILLHRNRIYIPLVLMTKSIGMNGKPYRFLLAGFSQWTTLGNSENKFMKCVYVTESDSVGTPLGGINTEAFTTERDEFLGINIEGVSISSVTLTGRFTFTVDMKLQVCKNLYEKYQKQMIKEMKTFKKQEQKLWKN